MIFILLNEISGYTDLILPLIESYPCLLDRAGVGGVTCRQLLGQLVRQREGVSSEVTSII